MNYKSIINVVAAIAVFMLVGCDGFDGDDKCGGYIRTDEHGNPIDTCGKSDF